MESILPLGNFDGGKACLPLTETTRARFDMKLTGGLSFEYELNAVETLSVVVELVVAVALSLSSGSFSISCANANCVLEEAAVVAVCSSGSRLVAVVVALHRPTRNRENGDANLFGVECIGDAVCSDKSSRGVGGACELLAKLAANESSSSAILFVVSSSPGNLPCNAAKNVSNIFSSVDAAVVPVKVVASSVVVVVVPRTSNGSSAFFGVMMRCCCCWCVASTTNITGRSATADGDIIPGVDVAVVAASMFAARQLSGKEVKKSVCRSIINCRECKIHRSIRMFTKPPPQW